MVKLPAFLQGRGYNQGWKGFSPPALKLPAVPLNRNRECLLLQFSQSITVNPKIFYIIVNKIN